MRKARTKSRAKRKAAAASASHRAAIEQNQAQHRLLESPEIDPAGIEISSEAAGKNEVCHVTYEGKRRKVFAVDETGFPRYSVHYRPQQIDALGVVTKTSGGQSFVTISHARRRDNGRYKKYNEDPQYIKLENPKTRTFKLADARKIRISAEA